MLNVAQYSPARFLHEIEIMGNLTEELVTQFPQQDNRTRVEHSKFLKSTYPQKTLQELMLRGFRALDELDVEDPAWDTLYDVLRPIWDALDEENRI